MAKNLIPAVGLILILLSLTSCHDASTEEPVRPGPGPYDTDMPKPKTTLSGPPAPSLYDDMLGDYAGICRSYSVDFDFSNGQYTYRKDTFDQVIKVAKVEDYSNHNLIVRTVGPHFPYDFIVSPNDLVSDTITMGGLWGGYRTIMTIVPAANYLYVYHIAYAPYGPGRFELWCNCFKGH